MSLGVRGGENKKAAYEAWHRLLAGVTDEKAEPTAADIIRDFLAGYEGPARPRTPGTTVGEVIKAFLADCEGRVKPKTLKWYKGWLEPFAGSHGGLVASDLTPPMAEAYSRKPEWADASRAGFLGTVVSAFRWAVRARLLAANPLAGVKAPPKPSRGAQTLISGEEHRTLMALASPTFGRFLRVLWATGARPGEVARITAENFDAEAGLVWLREHKTAHRGKSRVVHLTPEVVGLLADLARQYPTGPLLRTRWGKPWRDCTLVKEMIRLRERAGIPHATAYGYRHTFATDALAAGVPDAQVAELLGHSGTAMLHKHYSHLTAKARLLRGALNQVRGRE